VKQTLIVAGACLLLGAVVNLGVAWGLAVRQPPAVARQTYGLNDWMVLAPQRWSLRQAIMWRAAGQLSVTEFLNHQPIESARTPVANEAELLALLPAVSDLHRGSSIERDDQADALLTELHQPAYSYAEFYAGWPMLSLRYQQWTRTTRSEPNAGAVHRSRGLSTISEALRPYVGRHELPCSPLWTGVIVNSALYGACLGLIGLSLRSAHRGLRRLLRRWRNRCAACAYDLRGTAHERCPECGQAIRAKMNSDKT